MPESARQRADPAASGGKARARRSFLAVKRGAAEAEDASEQAAVLRLQRLAGNRATAELIGTQRPAAAPAVVQRHSSWEHTLLGNADPKAIADAVAGGSATARRHLVSEQLKVTKFFRSNPAADPRTRFPDVKWIQLRASKLWVSYGELNALADYLPPDIDSLDRSVVEPVVQRMRNGTYTDLTRIGLGIKGFKPSWMKFKGQAKAGVYENIEKIAADKAMDVATAPLGAQRYLGLVSRNACHFAPFSWHRWARFHEEARDNALAYHRGQKGARPQNSLDTEADEHLRQAWLKNGYGDHFLQDSFAAGHLVNKTLVMQWFVDYVNGLASKWWDLLGRMWWGDDTKPWYGMPSKDVMATMGTKAQPGIAGKHLYGKAPTGAGTAAADRALGDYPTDPQTASERLSHSGRRAGSGVRATAGRSASQNYQNYLAFLNSSFLQMAAGEVHDRLNDQGLVVGNERGDVLRVGGDNTLLGKSGPLGARMAAEAALLSRQAIEDLARTGTTAIRVETIWQIIPTYVWINKTEKLSLADWHAKKLHAWAVKEVFPGVVDSFASKAARAGQSKMIKGGVRDLPPPPLPREMGDFPPTRGAPRG